MAAEERDVTRRLVAPTDLKPGKNYIIRGMKLKPDVAIGRERPDAILRRYNPLYWEIDTEDLALGFVKNHRWSTIKDDPAIITNVHRDNDNPLVSEFTEVAELDGSLYPSRLSDENKRFIALEDSYFEFYEALETDVRVPAGTAKQLSNYAYGEPVGALGDIESLHVDQHGNLVVTRFPLVEGRRPDGGKKTKRKKKKMLKIRRKSTRKR